MSDTNFQRVAEALSYIRENFKTQPVLKEIAEKMHLSPMHFQRIFTEWAGVSPKKFLQYISIQYAKDKLKENKSSIFKTTFELGLSSTSRLHDLFVQVEGMTPAEYKNGGKNLNINYAFAPTQFGEVLIASTLKGVCYMAFIEHREDGFRTLQDKFPQSTFRNLQDKFQEQALSIFNPEHTLSDLKLHLKGTEFQLKVWESLLKIPQGKLSTYKNIAEQIDRPNASRAVGTAIGKNPIAFLIPCHRVITSTGELGGYMWGENRKAAIIGWEAACTDK